MIAKRLNLSVVVLSVCFAMGGLSAGSAWGQNGGGAINAIAWSPDGTQIVFGGNDDQLHITSGMMQNLFLFFVSPQWSYDSSRIAVVDGTDILIYDAVSGELLQRLEGHTDTILDVAWSPVDFRIASTSVDQTVKVWDGETGALLHDLTGHNEPVTQVVWSPDGIRLISSGFGNQPNLFVWDSQTGALELSTNAGTIVDAAFSPDGTVLIMSYSSGLSLFDGETLQRLIHQPPALCCVNQMETLSWSSDSSQIVTGSVSGLITIWDAATLTQINQFPANGNSAADSFDIPEPELHLSWVRAVAFGADGTILAVSGDGTVRQWDGDGHLLQEQQIGELETAAWSPSGDRLAVLRPQGTFEVIDSVFEAAPTATPSTANTATSLQEHVRRIRQTRIPNS